MGSVAKFEFDELLFCEKNPFAIALTVALRVLWRREPPLYVH